MDGEMLGSGCHLMPRFEVIKYWGMGISTLGITRVVVTTAFCMIIAHFGSVDPGSY